jgi:nicotinate-nucleotide pyrophosphorylase
MSNGGNMVLRDVLFRDLKNSFAFKIITKESGVIAGIDRVLAKAEESGLSVNYPAAEPMNVQSEETIFSAPGSAEQIATSAYLFEKRSRIRYE